MCSKGSVPLLERWCILKRAAYLLRGGTPLHFSLLYKWKDMECGERWHPSPTHLALLLFHLVHPSPTHGVPSLMGTFTHFTIEASTPPSCKLVGALGRITCVIIVIVLSFYIGIKKGFGGKLGVDLMCGCSLSCTNF